MPPLVSGKTKGGIFSPKAMRTSAPNAMACHTASSAHRTVRPLTMRPSDVLDVRALRLAAAAGAVNGPRRALRTSDARPRIGRNPGATPPCHDQAQDLDRPGVEHRARRRRLDLARGLRGRRDADR